MSISNMEYFVRRVDALASENARLKSEVERLRASSFLTAVPVEQYEKLKAEVEMWKLRSDNWQKLCQIAKEGKPQS